MNNMNKRKLLVLLVWFVCFRVGSCVFTPEFKAGLQVQSGNQNGGFQSGNIYYRQSTLAMKLQYTSPISYSQFYFPDPDPDSNGIIFKSCPNSTSSFCESSTDQINLLPDFDPLSSCQSTDAVSPPFVSTDGRSCSMICNRSPLSSNLIVSLTYDPSDSSPCVAVFQDGTEFTLSHITPLETGELIVRPSGCSLPTCQAVADIVLVLDESGSISYSGFQQLKDFSKTFVSGFDVSPTGVHFSAVWFSSDANSAHMLPFSSSVTEIHTFLDSHGQRGGYTCIGCGIRGGLEYFPNPLRVDPAPRVMLVVTDGENNRETDMFQDDINAAAAMSVNLFAVGIDGYDYNELLLITQNDSSHVFNVEDWTNLPNIIAPLSALMCEELPASDCANCTGICTCSSMCHCPICDAPDLCTYASCTNPSIGCEFSAIDCDDARACTVDSCQPSVGCVHTPIPSCTDCTLASECDDGDPCTLDECPASYVCQNTPLICQPSQNLCVLDLGCVAGNCAFQNVSCEDNDLCTDDFCDPLIGCVNTQIAGCCHSNTSCYDGDLCTVDLCTNHVCSNPPLECLPPDACHTSYCAEWGACKNEETLCPDDGDDCTLDICDPITGQCGIQIEGCSTGYSDCQDNNDCDDQLLCTEDICDFGNCSSHLQDCSSDLGTTVQFHPCSLGPRASSASWIACDPATGECQFSADPNFNGSLAAPCDCIPEMLGPSLTSPLDAYHASDFNLISFGGFLAGSGDVEGRLAVRGNVKIGPGFSVGYSVDSRTPNPQDKSLPWALVAGGNLTWFNGAVFPDGTKGERENIYVGGHVDEVSTPSFLVAQVTGGPGSIDPAFQQMEDYYRSLSLWYASQTPNANAVYLWNGLRLESTNNHSSRYYIQIGANEFSDPSWWMLGGLNPAAEFVVTITGSSDQTVVFSGGNFPGIAWKTVFNVFGPKEVVVYGECHGHLLAPEATLRQKGSDEVGLVVVADVAEFVECIKPPCSIVESTPVDDPYIPDPCAVAILNSNRHCIDCIELSSACRYCFSDGSCRSLGHPNFGDCCDVDSNGHIQCAFGNGTNQGSEGLCPPSEDIQECASGACCFDDAGVFRLRQTGFRCHEDSTCFHASFCNGSSPYCQLEPKSCELNDFLNELPPVPAGYIRVILVVLVDAQVDLATIQALLARLYAIPSDSIITRLLQPLSSGIRVVADVSISFLNETSADPTFISPYQGQAIGFKDAMLESTEMGPLILTSSSPNPPSNSQSSNPEQVSASNSLPTLLFLFVSSFFLSF